MSLKIPRETNFTIGLKNRIKEQCNESLDLLKTDEDPHEVIHEVRKSFKKIRGALRLVRDHVDFYKDENVFFRDEGRRISDIRDATSVIEALDALYERYTDQLYKKTFNQFRIYLLSRQAEMEKRQVEERKVLKTIQERLSSKCQKIEDWPIRIESFEDLAPSVERVYKRGRKTFHQARKSRATEDFHEWRKRVKYLRYQLDLLNRIWPDLLACWEDELHDLSDCLGDDRDLYMLANVMEENEDGFSDHESYELMKSIIQIRREQLQACALRLGEKLYRLEKEVFIDLLRAAWEVNSEKSAEAER